LTPAGLKVPVQFLALAVVAKSGPEQGISGKLIRTDEYCRCGADADGKRFIVRADEKLTAFLELEAAIHEFAVSLIA
jgi:hypothetical protein